MDDVLKQRLVGAAVLVAIGVIFIPMVLDGPPDLGTDTAVIEIPPRPEPAANTRLLPIEPPAQDQAPARPETPQTDAPTGTRTADVPAAADAAPTAGDDLTTWWVVQVGSFSEEDNAMAFRDRFRDAGYSAFVEPVGEGSERRYRVRLGPEQDRARAEAVRSEVKDKFDLEGLVLTNS